MKRGAPNHPKMHRLALALKSPLYSAVGLLEMLWHYAGAYTPRGDIGIVDDEHIAKGVDWRRKPAALIEMLVNTKWLDLDAQHRLIVHDWPDHADDVVRKKLARMGLDFLPVYSRRRSIVRSSVSQRSVSGQSASDVHARLGYGSGNGNGTGRAGPPDDGNPLAADYERVLLAWPDDKRGVDLGMQFWLSLIDCGELTSENLPAVFEGLERWKTSDLWHRDGGKYIPAIANAQGTGWLQKRAWKDYPKQFIQEANW